MASICGMLRNVRKAHACAHTHARARWRRYILQARVGTTHIVDVKSGTRRVHLGSSMRMMDMGKRWMRGAYIKRPDSDGWIRERQIVVSLYSARQKAWAKNILKYFLLYVLRARQWNFNINFAKFNYFYGKCESVLGLKTFEAKSLNRALWP